MTRGTPKGTDASDGVWADPGRFAVLMLRGAVRGYQLFLGPVLPRTCRFHPSCSTYALEALKAHGAIRGTGLAARRLVRCHPWGGGGIDPVPAARPRS
jgi:putative membrane protein insertion efficiency factor